MHESRIKNNDSQKISLFFSDPKECKKMENNLRLLMLIGGIKSIGLILELKKSLKKDCGGRKKTWTYRNSIK